MRVLFVERHDHDESRTDSPERRDHRGQHALGRPCGHRCRPGSTARGARCRRVRSARRQSDRRGPRRACRGGPPCAADRCRTPPRRSPGAAAPAARRRRSPAPRPRRPSPRRIARAVASSPGPHVTSTCAAASCTRRRASVVKCATGHRVAGAGAGVQHDQSPVRLARRWQPLPMRCLDGRARGRWNMQVAAPRCRAAPAGRDTESTTCRAAGGAARDG